MKKLFILLISVLVFPAVVYAATATDEADMTTTTTTTTIQYELPYPGILPDHPLYILKQVRDWVLDKLIADPVKKAEFYILQADKRLNAGLMLAENGKDVTSEQVISKGEKYMNNALTLLLTLKAQGRDIPAYITDRLEKALAKHKELLEQAIANATESTKSGLEGSLALVRSMQETLKTLK